MPQFLLCLAVAVAVSWFASLSWFAIGAIIAIVGALVVVALKAPLPEDPLDKERAELNSWGFVVDQWFVSTTKRSGANCDRIAMDTRGRIAVRWNGDWEGLDLEKVRGVTLDVTDKQTSKTTGSRSVTGAVVGGAIAGPIGAIVGGSGRATTSIANSEIEQVILTISMRDLKNPVRRIDFGNLLSDAREWESRLQTAVELHSPQPSETGSFFEKVAVAG